MIKLYVPISRETLEKIVKRAREERRRPQDEAALLLEKAIANEVLVRSPASAAEPTR